VSEAVCRWGILGTAGIARKNWKAIRHAGNARLVAVASRDPARARAFIDECQADVPLNPPPAACGAYEELLARKDVDAVYVPLPTGVRKEWVLKAAAAGKHVLCEKPCGATAADVRAMTEACARAGVQFMDGVMFMHSARLPQLRQVLDDGQTVGPLRRIASQFTFLADDTFLKQNIRARSDLEPLGCLGDLGWYNLRFTLWVMKEQMPRRVSGRLLAAHDPGQVPMEFSGELFFADGVSASFYCSFITENQQWAHVSGTRGYAHLDDFVLPFFGAEVGFTTNKPTFTVSGCEFAMESRLRRHAAAEYSNSSPRSQEANLIRDFSTIVTSGKLEPRWAEQALKTQTVLDACLASARADGRLVDVAH